MYTYLDDSKLAQSELIIIDKVKVTQVCLTLFDPMDYAVCGILQARILEWVAFPSPGDLPNPGIKPRSPTLQVEYFTS